MGGGGGGGGGDWMFCPGDVAELRFGSRSLYSAHGFRSGQRSERNRNGWILGTDSLSGIALQAGSETGFSVGQSEHRLWQNMIHFWV